MSLPKLGGEGRTKSSLYFRSPPDLEFDDFEFALGAGFGFGFGFAGFGVTVGCAELKRRITWHAA